MNEIAHDISTVEEFERRWPMFPKNQIFFVGNHPPAELHLAWKGGPLKVFVSGIVGSKGGLSEQVLAVDSSIDTCVHDRLVLGAWTHEGGYFLPLVEMRRQKFQEGKDPFELCRREMQRLLAEVLGDPIVVANRTRKFAKDQYNSIAAVSGGLPSLGKGSR